MSDQRGDEDDDTENVEDPDERQERDHDLPPVIVTDKAIQAQKQRGPETEVGGCDDQPHPPKRLSERLPVRVLCHQPQRD